MGTRSGAIQDFQSLAMRFPALRFRVQNATIFSIPSFQFNESGLKSPATSQNGSNVTQKLYLFGILRSVDGAAVSPA
jgi:hypothetical protein